MKKKKTCSPLAWQHPARNPQNRIEKIFNLRDHMLMKGKTNCEAFQESMFNLIKKLISF